MPTVNDCMLSSLRSFGYTGTIEDMLIKYYQDNGAGPGVDNVRDAEMAFLEAQGAVDWYDLLTQFGYSGALADKELQFWCLDGGGVEFCPIETSPQWELTTGTTPSPLCVSGSRYYQTRQASGEVYHVFHMTPANIQDLTLEFDILHSAGTAFTGISVRADSVAATWIMIRFNEENLEVFDKTAGGYSNILTVPGDALASTHITMTLIGSEVTVSDGSSQWTATTSIVQAGDWGWDVSTVTNESYPVDLYGGVRIQEIVAREPSITSMREIQIKTPPSTREHILELTFDMPVLSDDATGLTLTANGNTRPLTLYDGSGTDTLRFKSTRVIFKNTLELAYDGSGNIRSADYGIPLSAFAATSVNNQLPSFTLWDWDDSSGSEDTRWDPTDDEHETKWDEGL